MIGLILAAALGASVPIIQPGASFTSSGIFASNDSLTIAPADLADPGYLRGVCLGLRVAMAAGDQRQIETGNNYDPRGWPIRLAKIMRDQDATTTIGQSLEGGRMLICPPQSAPSVRP